MTDSPTAGAGAHALVGQQERLVARATSSSTAAAPSSRSLASRSSSYSDAIGDSELAPDISSITVTHSGGQLLFRIGIANIGPGLIDGEFIAVMIDADRNSRTGCGGSGSDVSLSVLGSTAGNDTAAMMRCVGGTWRLQGGLSFSYVRGSGLYGPGSVSFQASAASVGSTSFAFIVGTSYEGILNDYYDFAGPFSFNGQATPAAPSSPPRTSPPPPAQTPPVITPPADVRAEATGPEGARVAYRAASVKGATSVTYSKASGSVFPLGRTVVTITARNRAGTARKAFEVRVVDTTKPSFLPVNNISTNATAAGTVVTYGPVRATDRVDRSPAVGCTPPSDGIFPAGATDVSCTARDRSGNTGTARFRVVAPVFAGLPSLQTSTNFQYDSARRLVGAGTAIVIPALNSTAGGIPIAYSWTATSGTISGTGVSAIWTRAVQGAQLAPGTVTVTVSYNTGETATFLLEFA